MLRLEVGFMFNVVSWIKFYYLVYVDYDCSIYVLCVFFINLIIRLLMCEK